MWGSSIQVTDANADPGKKTGNCDSISMVYAGIKIRMGPGEVTQQLGTLDAFAEAPR